MPVGEDKISEEWSLSHLLTTLVGTAKLLMAVSCRRNQNVNSTCSKATDTAAK